MCLCEDLICTSIVQASWGQTTQLRQKTQLFRVGSICSVLCVWGREKYNMSECVVKKNKGILKRDLTLCYPLVDIISPSPFAFRFSAKDTVSNFQSESQARSPRQSTSWCQCWFKAHATDERCCQWCSLLPSSRDRKISAAENLN